MHFVRDDYFKAQPVKSLKSDRCELLMYRLPELYNTEVCSPNTHTPPLM